MNYNEAKAIVVSEPQRRFIVIFPNERDMAMDEHGMRIYMRGIVPSFKIDEAFEIARKFHGEVI